jgi:membrane protease YdiL (CAAX protease family)
VSWDVVAGVVLAVLPLAVVIPVAAGAYAALGDRVESPVVGIALFEIACLLVAGGYLLLSGDPVAVRVVVPTAGGVVLALAAVPFPFALGAVSERVLEPFGVEMESGLSVSRRELPWMVLVSLVLVGPAEELLYRGVVQGVLARSLGTGGGVLVMAVLFGAVHYPSYGAESLADVDAGVVAGAVQTATVGVVYGALYVATASLLVPVLTHSIYDAVLFARIAREGDADEGAPPVPEQQGGETDDATSADGDAQTSTENPS